MTNKKNALLSCRRDVSVLIALIGIYPLQTWADADGGRDPVRANEVLGLSVTQALRYDSNVFRLADDTSTAMTSQAGQRHDFISTTTLRAGVDKDFGRNHIFLLAAPSIIRYARFSDLDYIGQDFLGDLVGRLGTNGHYGVNYEHVKVATDPADQVVPTGNTATSDRLGFDLAVPAGPRWQAVTGWRADRTRNSSETEQGGDNHGWAADAGVRFLPASGNNIDLRYRHSRYDYPNIIPSTLADNSYSQNEIELSGNVQIDDPSRLEGRVSYVRREHDNFAERNFSGMVGALKYLWRPTVATSITTSIFKDIGAVTDSSASYAKSYGISIQPLWDATAKIALGTLVEWRRRTYSGFAIDEPRAPEHTTRVGLSAHYMATRNWQLGFDVSDERRRSSAAAQNYSDVISNLTAQWKM